MINMSPTVFKSTQDTSGKTYMLNHTDNFNWLTSIGDLNMTKITENEKAGLQLCVFAALCEYVKLTSIYTQVHLETL